MEILENLNDLQKEICKFEGNILVNSCPGSGKTRTLTHKIAYLINKYPFRKRKIVAITFTNKASDEIYNRILDMGLSTERVWCGTIHQFCLDWIIHRFKMYNYHLSSGFKIIDNYRKESYIQEIAEELDINITNKLINTTFSRDLKLNEQDEELIPLIKKYYKLLREKREIDFDLILACAYKLIIKKDFIGSLIKEAIELICIDEYQDTPDLQYAILEQIYNSNSNSNMNIVFFGDPNQAIYKSLGGVVKSIDELNSNFMNSNFKEMTLNGCYRSTQRIVDIYSKFMITQYSIESLGKNKNEKGFLYYNNTINKDKLAPLIANIIKKCLEKGIPENQICITAPVWSMLYSLSRKLKILLPDVKFDSPEVTPIKKNPFNIFYLISKILLLQPSLKSFEIKIRIMSRIKKILNEEYNVDIMHYKSLDLVNLLNKCKVNVKSGYQFIKETITKFLEKLKIYKQEHEELFSFFKSFLENIEFRINEKRFCLNDDLVSFYKMFQYNNGVVIDTCHGIKGQEYHVVIAFGLLHGRIPNWEYIGKIYENQEMKKMLYVIMSRAKNRLYLFSERGRFYGKNQKEYQPTKGLGQLNFDKFD